MKYSIEWMEVKTSAKGNKYATCSLKDEAGKVTTDVAIFSSFPNFESLKAADNVEGEIKSKDYNGRTSYTFEALNVAPSAPRRASGAITAAMEKKEHSIEKFQGNKELSIKISSTLRMAVDTALAFLQRSETEDTGVFMSEVKDWRKFYWQEWDKEEKDYPPF